METDIEKSLTDVDRDLSSEWIELSTRVRGMTTNLQARTVGTTFADDTSLLAVETARLCDHLERIHRDVAKLLVELDDKVLGIDLVSSDVDPDAVQRATIQIHRETHELRADFKDIIKALFMWQDDPVTRAREKK